jgi:hypothetical protein
MPTGCPLDECHDLTTANLGLAVYFDLSDGEDQCPLGNRHLHREKQEQPWVRIIVTRNGY